MRYTQDVAPLIRVVCVKWGNKYGQEWVYRLRRMLNRHFRPHQFVCMTDKPIHGVECVPCPEGLPGWWAKVGLFEPGKFPGWNLYLDLDVVITASIAKIDEGLTEDKVWARDDFSYSLLNHKNLDPHAKKLLGGDGTVNSSVMLWKGGAGRRVWDEFSPGVMDVLHGDQNWITQRLWPDEVGLLDNKWACSYKYHIQRGESAKPIVVFHGDPKVTQLSRKDPLRVEWEA